MPSPRQAPIVPSRVSIVKGRSITRRFSHGRPRPLLNGLRAGLDRGRRRDPPVSGILRHGRLCLDRRRLGSRRRFLGGPPGLRPDRDHSDNRGGGAGHDQHRVSHAVRRRRIDRERQGSRGVACRLLEPPCHPPVAGRLRGADAPRTASRHRSVEGRSAQLTTHPAVAHSLKRPGGRQLRESRFIRLHSTPPPSGLSRAACAAESPTLPPATRATRFEMIRCSTNRGGSHVHDRTAAAGEPKQGAVGEGRLHAHRGDDAGQR